MNKLLNKTQTIPVEQGYNICLIFLLRLWPFVNEQLSAQTEEVQSVHYVFFELVCFEAESYLEWQDAVLSVTNILFEQQDDYNISLDRCFECVIAFCNIYNIKHNSQLEYTVHLLENMKRVSDQFSAEWQIWEGAVSDVINGRKYICSNFFWRTGITLGRFPEDTPENRRIINQLFNDPANRVGVAGSPAFKKDVYWKKLSPISHLWGFVNSGERHFNKKNIIADVGINLAPTQWLMAWFVDPLHENGGHFAPLARQRLD